MRTELDRELVKLLVETNEQRRRFGQAIYHFYRTLVFWLPKGRSFLQVTQAWSAGGAAIFDALALTLNELGDHAPDPALRTFVARVLDQLADDLERGDNMLVPYLRWLEGRFPELTQMIREESVGSRIFDYELARELANLLTLLPDSDRTYTVTRLRESARGLEATSG